MFQDTAQRQASALLARAPPGGAAADAVALERGPAAGAAASRAPLRIEAAGVGAAGTDRVADSRPHLAPQPVQLVLAQLARRAAGGELGPPQDLVDEQVAQTGHRGL